jgi:hypothetical protein
MAPIVRAKCFISHNHRDNEVAERIAEELVKAGAEVWVDDWEMHPGDSLIAKISEAIVDSYYLVALLSKDSVQSSWVNKELEIALTRQISDKSIKVIPCLIDDCVIPPFLQPIFYADFRDGFDKGIKALLPAIKPVDLAAEGRLSADDETWIHDFAIDYDINHRNNRTPWFRVTIISQYPLERYSAFFVMEVEPIEQSAKRLRKYPDHLGVFRLVTFMIATSNAFTDTAAKNRKDLHITFNEAELVESTFKLPDLTGGWASQITITARRAGDFPTACALYYYGELISHRLNEFLRKLGKEIPKELVQEFELWKISNPF